MATFYWLGRERLKNFQISEIYKDSDIGIFPFVWVCVTSGHILPTRKGRLKISKIQKYTQTQTEEYRLCLSLCEKGRILLIRKRALKIPNIQKFTQTKEK